MAFSNFFQLAFTALGLACPHAVLTSFAQSVGVDREQALHEKRRGERELRPTSADGHHLFRRQSAPKRANSAIAKSLLLSRLPVPLKRMKSSVASR